jgi:hypothetical protein
MFVNTNALKRISIKVMLSCFCLYHKILKIHTLVNFLLKKIYYYIDVKIRHGDVSLCHISSQKKKKINS